MIVLHLVEGGKSILLSRAHIVSIEPAVGPSLFQGSSYVTCTAGNWHHVTESARDVLDKLNGPRV